MIGIEEAKSSIDFAKERLETAAIWGAASAMRLALLIVGISIVTVVAFLGFINYLLLSSQAETVARMEPYGQMVEDGRFIDALETISSCIEANKDRLKDTKLYCDEAIARYRSVQHGRMPTNALEKRIQSQAFLSWRDDMNSMLRKNRQSRLLNAPESFERKFRTLVFTWWGLSLLYVVAFIPVFYLIFLIHKRMKQNRFA